MPEPGSSQPPEENKADPPASTKPAAAQPAAVADPSQKQAVSKPGQNAGPQKNARRNTQKSAGKSNAPKADGASGAKTSAIAMLTADHRKVEALFARFEKAEDDDEKAALTRQICAELTVHTLLEEELFYRACRQAAGNDEEARDGLDEAQVEHDSAKLLIADLWTGGERDEFRDAKVKVLAEQIRHHVSEEEKPGEGVFAKAKASGIDTPQLGERLGWLKGELQVALQDGRLGPTRPVSIDLQPRPQGRYPQEDDMPRNGPDRDERGRFTSDDDDRGGGRYAQGNRGRNQYSDDDRGGGRGGGGRGQGGWFGDSEGHSQASREGWEERRSYGRGRDDDDDRGYRSRGRDDDDDRRGGGRGQGGWFGDSEGHSRAAREGWDNPDHGRSGWFGDSRGHSEASRRGWENSDHGPSGWFGDSRGHSEASRRGWDDRDDRGGYRSRGRDDDDDRRGGRGGGGGRGQGGWFGDSEGHSQASRRGWDDRR